MRKALAGLFLTGVSIMVSSTLQSEETARSAAAGFTPGEKVVLLGDSLTDGGAWPLLVKQALKEAGKPTPLYLNAAVGGSTAGYITNSLDDLVFRFQPDTVMIFNSGLNDASMKRTADQYLADMTELIRRLQEKKLRLIVVIQSIPGPRHMKEAEQEMAGFYEPIRQLAKDSGVTVAEAGQVMTRAWKSGIWLWEPDQGHLNLDGNRAIARAVLDALGHEDIPMPETFKADPAAGLVPSWKFIAVSNNAPALDEKAVAALKPDDTWKALAVPDPEPKSHWWQEQVRQEGYLMGLDKAVGAGQRFIGIATVTMEKACTKHLNTGASVGAVWINGKQVFKEKGADPKGFHGGRERIAVPLQAGANTIVVETGGNFILNLTDTLWW